MSASQLSSWPCSPLANAPGPDEPFLLDDDAFRTAAFGSPTTELEALQFPWLADGYEEGVLPSAGGALGNPVVAPQAVPYQERPVVAWSGAIMPPVPPRETGGELLFADACRQAERWQKQDNRALSDWEETLVTKKRPRNGEGGYWHCPGLVDVADELMGADPLPCTGLGGSTFVERRYDDGSRGASMTMALQQQVAYLKTRNGYLSEALEMERQLSRRLARQIDSQQHPSTMLQVDCPHGLDCAPALNHSFHFPSLASPPTCGGNSLRRWSASPNLRVSELSLPRHSMDVCKRPRGGMPQLSPIAENTTEPAYGTFA